MTDQASPAFQTGETCYDINGAEHKYIGFFESRHAVVPCYYQIDGEEEPFYGDLYLIDQVFKSPPLERRHDEIQRLDGLITEKMKTLQELSDKVRAEQRAFDDAMARLKDCEELVKIDRFLAGEITHFVFYTDHDAQVKTFEQAIVNSESRDTAYRLLSLFGDSKRKVKWGIASYSDGSGSTRWNVIPCCSFEEAQAKAVELHTAALKTLNRSNHYQVTNWIKQAGALGISVPEDLAKIGHELALKSAKSTLDCRQKSLEESQRLFNAAQKALADLTIEVQL